MYPQFYYMEFDNEVESTEYWKSIYCSTTADHWSFYGLDYLPCHFAVCKIYYEDLKLCQYSPTASLLYETPDDSLHLEVYDEGHDAVQQLLALSDAAPLGRTSPWTGFYVVEQYDESFTGQYPAGVFRFYLPPPEESGEVRGSGTDSVGDFVIRGTVNGTHVEYNKRYTFLGGHIVRYQGTLTADRDTVEGVWGFTVSGQNIDDLTAPLGESDVAGRFKHWVAPPRFSFIRLDDVALAKNKPRAMWEFAISTVLHRVRIQAGHFTWEYLSERRRIRKRFIELYSRLDNLLASWPDVASVIPLAPQESEELAALVGLLSEQDLRFYKSLCAALQRRRIIHW